MELYFFFFLTFLIKLSKNINYIYQAKDIIEYLNKDAYAKKDLDEIKNNIAKTFDEFYAFDVILNNPPQPPFNPDYHQKMNISNEIREINTNAQSLYNFYHELIKIMGKSKDGHTYILFDKILNISNFVVFSPIEFYIKNDAKGKPRLYGKPFVKEELQKYFKNYEHVFKTINDNLNNYISSINGQDPFEYLMNYASDYFNLRNPHGTFSAKFYSFNRFSLSRVPLSVQETIDFNVTYENGQFFITDFLLQSDREIIPGIKNNYVKEITNSPFRIVNIDKDGVYNFGNREELLKDSNLEWNFNYENKFKCRVDDENELNVYYINSFSTQNSSDFFSVIKNCAFLFDENKYKTILISSLNGGGILYVSQLLLELFSTTTNFNYYLRIRNTNTIKSKFDDFPVFTTDTCEIKPISALLKKETRAFYGNKLTDLISEPFTVNPYRYMSNETKSKMKNIRRPNELLVFTDYLSFSAASVFMKYLQYFGGGIVVGYFGIPGRDDIPLDSGISPSATVDTASLMRLDEFKILYEKYGIQMHFACMQSFYDEFEKNIPLEFGINTS